MKRLLPAILILLTTLAASAQVEGTQYFMDNLPQVVGNNPAFVPKYKFSLSLPLISSVGFGYYNNGFSYNDLITKSNGETQADLSKWVKSLTDKNYIGTTAQVDLLRFGFKVNSKLYIQANMTAREYSRFQIPKGLTSLFVNGTAPLVGTSTSFSPEVQGLAYVETGAGASYQVNDQLTIGARVKYLTGIANATTSSSNVSVSVGTDYQISAAADLDLKTSGIRDNGKDLKNFRSNSGYGIDLGGTYKLTEKLMLAASIIDLGKITWRNNPYAYTLDKSTANYSFSGIKLKEVVDGNSSYLNSQSDSIQNNFKPKQAAIGSYSTWLPGKVYVSGRYELVKNLYAGALLFNEKFQGRSSSGISASVLKHFGKWMTTSVSYTVSNRSYNNVGLGFSLNLAPIQFYVVGDNLLRVPVSLISGNMNSYVNSTQVFNVRFGLNFVWGWDNGVEKLKHNTKSYNDSGKSTGRQKVTSGNAKSLKVRKKTRVGPK